MTGIRKFNDFRETARHITGTDGHGHKPCDDDDHLEEIRHRHGPHTAVHGVKEHDERTDRHTGGNAHETFGDEVQHQPQRRNLRSHPTEVGNDDENRAGKFDLPSVTATVKVADGQKIHLVELTGKKHPN